MFLAHPDIWACLMRDTLQPATRFGTLPYSMHLIHLLVSYRKQAALLRRVCDRKAQAAKWCSSHNQFLRHIGL